MDRRYSWAGRDGWAARFYARSRTDPGRVISMSIAIADTFRRTMGISFHLLFHEYGLAVLCEALGCAFPSNEPTVKRTLAQSAGDNHAPGTCFGRRIRSDAPPSGWACII
jgi:hypothetical protein